jgi:Secretion system C-terminal sorting domain
LNAVTSIQISAKPNTGTGGTGTLYFDAIELIDDPNVLVTSRIVYKDGASTINGNWNGTLGAGSVAAITTDAPYEGGQHYRFNYSFGTGSFDGFGLQFYSGANFSGKTYLRIAYRGTGVAHTMQIRLSDGTNTTTVYDVGDLSSSTYQVANLAIASFPGIGSVNLNAVTSIQISAKPNTGTGGTGTLFFDAIELTNSTLPIELLSFKATPLSKIVQLDWKTASEKNARHFDVERSLDGKKFSSIGIIKASGTSNTLLTYNFDDENPLNGLTYYRLRQVDFDGTTAFSGIVSVNRNKGTKLVLAPNPAQNTIAVTLAGNEQRANLTVYDLLGKAVLTKTMEGSSANLDLSALPSSTYLLEIVSNGQVFREKLVKN